MTVPAAGPSSPEASTSQPRPQASPSVPTSKPAPRVATFVDSSDEDEDEDPAPKALANGHNNPNGNGGTPKKKRKLDAGGRTAGGAAGAGELGETGTEAQARKKEAERLFEKRQELPFYQGRKMILEEIMANDTTIILGETGCGKSTQLPQLLRTHSISLDHFSPPSKHSLALSSAFQRYQRGPSIAVTQPRRLPAIALANRVAAEMGCQLGGEVGYSVRFEDVCRKETRVRYLTEGVLMRELANPDVARAHTAQPNGSAPSPSPSLEDDLTSSSKGLNLLLNYDIIILDEAHERTLNTDFLCGALKRVQRIRKELVRREKEKEAEGKGKGKGLHIGGRRVKELKIVVMSATLDPTKFKVFFETGRDALLVKGRMYDVATQHVVDPVDDFIEAAARQVIGIHCNPTSQGDVLVFMPGSEEIENCVELLRRAAKQLPTSSSPLQILPLYAALPPSAQAKIFLPPPKSARRVIVATNIAETSMTIPGVGYVVDTGYKKEKEYVFRASGAIEQLKKKGISKAAAWQRTGRAGRERAGQCFRLFTEKAFKNMPEFDAPEIQRCNLSSAVLQLIAMGQNPFEFEYIDNPGREAIAAAFQVLAGLEALSSPTTITPLGLQLLRFPLDPPHARILISSFDLGCPLEIIDILSLVNAGGNVFIDRPNDRDDAAAARAKFLHRDGDHLTGMNVLRAYAALKESHHAPASASAGGAAGRPQSLATWCRDNHVNGKTLAQAMKVRDQLRELAEKLGKDWKASCGSESSGVMRALLQGLFMNTAVVQADGSYRQTAGSLTVKIHPSSVLMSKKVPAILYDELTVTSAFYARNVSAFEQHWLTEIAWFAKAGSGVAAPVQKGTL